MMILMMKMGKSILSQSVRIFTNDFICIYIESFRPKKDLISEQSKSV
jgi:hypothetical protein